MMLYSDIREKFTRRPPLKQIFKRLLKLLQTFFLDLISFLYGQAAGLEGVLSYLKDFQPQ